MNNRIHNAGNPHQGKAKRVLCVCSAGLLRSPTAAVVLQQEYGFNTRAVGVDAGHALICIDAVHLVWADLVVCMDLRQARAIEALATAAVEAGTPMTCPKIKVLHVPDRFAYMDEKLQEEILKGWNRKDPQELSDV